MVFDVPGDVQVGNTITGHQGLWRPDVCAYAWCSLLSLVSPLLQAFKTLMQLANELGARGIKVES